MFNLPGKWSPDAWKLPFPTEKKFPIKAKSPTEKKNDKNENQAQLDVFSLCSGCNEDDHHSFAQEKFAHSLVNAEKWWEFACKTAQLANNYDIKG